MLREVLDMQILLPLHFVFNQAPRALQLLNQGLDVELVMREHLTLKLLGRTVKPAMVVCEVQCADEE